MPTYQYRCVDCGSELETVQKFSDPSLTDCPECDGTLRKVYSAVGVVFKGSGFYATDNRTKGKSAAASVGSGGSDKPSGSDNSAGSEKSSSGGKSTSDSSSASKPASSSTTSAA